MEAGPHSVIWSGDNTDDQPCASGIYFFRVNTASGSLTQKMMLLK